MKKFVAMILVVLAVMNVSAFAMTTDNLYAKTAVVVEVNEEEDYFVLRDFNGNEWVYEEVEDWEVGDIASMIMNDCGTPSIFDDEIISIRYDGWMEAWEEIFENI